MVDQRAQPRRRTVAMTGTPRQNSREGAEISRGGESGMGSTGKFMKSDGELTSALLVEAVEIENRLRQHILELLEPTIQKQKVFEMRMRDSKLTIEKTTDDVSHIKKLMEGTESLRGVVEGFRVELAEWDRERRDHEQQVGDRLSLQEIEINALRQSLERKNADTNSYSRTLKGLEDLVLGIQEQTGELRKYCVERLDLNRDKITKLRDEFETREMAVENEQYRLQDQQTRTDTMIAHMKAELARVGNSVGDIVNGVADLWSAKASVGCVEEQQQEFSEFARQVNTHVSGLRQQFGSLVDDVKAHFQTAAHVVGTSTAKQMDDMREHYQEEVQRVDTVLGEIADFVEIQKEQQTKMKTVISDIQEAAKKEVDSLRGSLESQSQKIGADCMNLTIEVQQLRRTTREMEGAAMGQDHGRNLRNDITSMLVESQLLGAMLDMQDDQDRKSIALFGIKANDEKQKDTSRTCSLPELNGAAGGGRSSSATPRTAQTSQAPVMTIDKRCLSCSGSAATVLAGFKLACLQYAPSPVDYQKVTYSRSELIRLRMDLLQQAKEQLRSVD